MTKKNITPPPPKKHGEKTNPGPGVTANILSRLLSSLLGLEISTIRSMFSRQSIRLSNIDDVVQFLRDKITPPPKIG